MTNFLDYDSWKQQNLIPKTSQTLKNVEAGKELLKMGSSDLQAVTELQKKLKAAGFFSSEITGKFDSKTKDALTDFQSKNGLTADGILGAKTYSALFGKTGIPSMTAQTFSFDRKVKHGYTGEKAANIQILIEEMEKAGVSNPYSQIAILSVIGKESNFIPKSEKMNYSAGRLAEVWKRFSKTGSTAPKGQGASYKNALADQYANNPEKLANYTYGGRNGNGPESSGDGWKYRGRGFNQITFKGTYEKYGKMLGLDLVGNPDLLNDPKVAARAAVRFLLERFKSKGIDPNSFRSQGEAITAFAHANAGWGSNPSNAIANAMKYSPEFSLA
jgi:putative chitinase